MLENFFNSETMLIVAGLFIPIIGCVFGSATVFLLKSDNNAPSQKFMLGFAAGVMLAASVWSLLLPSLELGVKRPGFQGAAGEFIGRIRPRQEVKGKNYVVCDILGSWEQDKVKPGDVIFAD